jgi:AbrB family looped-hinge helix DNA binding protein
MAKVTSKLQVTVPKALAERYGIRPGDDITWHAAGDAIRLVPGRRLPVGDLAAQRLTLFDRAQARQRGRERARGKRKGTKDRGWRREDLYERGRAR